MFDFWIIFIEAEIFQGCNTSLRLSSFGAHERLRIRSVFAANPVSAAYTCGISAQ